MTQAPVAFVVFVTWVLNTFSQSQSKRASAVALINSMGICGNIGASSVHIQFVVYAATDVVAGTSGLPVGDLHTSSHISFAS
jgi:hypothetical protein